MVANHRINWHARESTLQQVIDPLDRGLNCGFARRPNGVIDNVSGEVDIVDFL